jgi:hypothetical protein
VSGIPPSSTASATTVAAARLGRLMFVAGLKIAQLRI